MFSKPNSIFLTGMVAAIASTSVLTAISTGSVIVSGTSSSTGFTVPTANDVLYHEPTLGGATGSYSASIANPPNATEASWNGSGGYRSDISGLGYLFDGIAPSNQFGNNWFGVAGGTGSSATVVTVPLQTASALDSIATYTVWGDSGRVNQSYSVSYSTDGGSTYTTLDSSVAYTYSLATTPAATEVVLTDSSGGALAGGAIITDLQFTFGPQQNNGVAYSEIAAYAPVPEPSTLSVLGVGAAGLLLLLRRRTA
ncbi:MAG: PEP-CTERM sorting domain-containing protein [Phycisphaerales bacterium]|nr:PEP-CTERM sorting domain-containing protein [Phycisphaerales bacterium]